MCLQAGEQDTTGWRRSGQSDQGRRERSRSRFLLHPPLQASCTVVHRAYASWSEWALECELYKQTAPAEEAVFSHSTHFMSSMEWHRLTTGRTLHLEREDALLACLLRGGGRRRRTSKGTVAILAQASWLVPEPWQLEGDDLPEIARARFLCLTSESASGA